MGCSVLFRNRKASGGRELSASGLSDAPAYVRLSQFRQDKGSEILHGLRCKWCTWSSVLDGFVFMAYPFTPMVVLNS